MFLIFIHLNRSVHQPKQSWNYFTTDIKNTLKNFHLLFFRHSSTNNKVHIHTNFFLAWFSNIKLLQKPLKKKQTKKNMEAHLLSPGYRG